MTACDVSYEIRYTIRGSQAAITEQTIQAVEWSRRLDDVSTAKVTHVLSDVSCCDDLGRIEPWSDVVEIRQNGRIVWYGWITSVEYSRSTVVVEASDALIWARYRIINNDYDKNQDSALHFRDLWNDAISVSPINVTVDTSMTKVVESRKYSASNRRAVWFVLKELMENSVDVTVLGNIIYVGGLSFGRDLYLNDDDFSGDIVIRKAGEYYANQVFVEGARSIAAKYPDAAVTGDGIYPLVQDIVYDEGITSAASAQALAKSRYEYTAGIVPRIVRAGDALQLRQGALDVRDLIPSRIVNLTTNQICFSGSQQYRLGGVDVSYAAGVETIGISLQPIGTLVSLEGISADDDTGGTTGGGS